MKYLVKSIITTVNFGIIIIATGCATNSKMVSDSHNPGMTKIVYSVDIKASKNNAWKVLSDFTNLSWSKGVVGAHYLNDKRSRVGMARHCDLKDDGYIVERITQWNEGNGFTYEIDNASDPIVPGSYAIWTIEGNDSQSKVTFEVHYELKYGIVGDMMNAAFAKNKFSTRITEFMGELKNHVEKST